MRSGRERLFRALAVGCVHRHTCTRGQAELAQDVLDVDLHRGLGDVQHPRDFLVAHTARNLAQHFFFARGTAVPLSDAALPEARPPPAAGAGLAAEGASLRLEGRHQLRP